MIDDDIPDAVPPDPTGSIPPPPPISNGADGETEQVQAKAAKPKKPKPEAKAEENAEKKPVDVPPAADSIFARAIRARAEAGANPPPREVKKPARIRPTMKMTGWFRTHPEVFYPGLVVFAPKDEGMDEPMWVYPELANELREYPALMNAIKTVDGYLCCTAAGAMYLMLITPDDGSGRRHEAIDAKEEAVRAAREAWTRLDWNKDTRQFDTSTAENMTRKIVWPEDVSEVSIMTRVFGAKKVIDRRDHPVIVNFLGE